MFLLGCGLNEPRHPLSSICILLFDRYYVRPDLESDVTATEEQCRVSPQLQFP